MWFEEKSVTLAEPPADRVQETLLRVRAARAVLSLLDSEMLAFKGKYKVRADRFGRLLAIESPTLGGRAVIEQNWRALLTKRDRAVSEWHGALHAHADAKEWQERSRKETAA